MTVRTLADPHLPEIHLRPPRNWVNDPNGLVFHDGYYHVFFQYNPDSSRHANMHWGHFRSPDLVRWEPLPVALAPTPGGEDADGVWSGNAVSTDVGLVVFYSAKRDDRWWQPIASATSADGITFTKQPALLIAEPPHDTTMWRDPYVWRDGDRWRMLVGAALADGRGAALHYESRDLVEWTYRGPFLAREPSPLPGGGDTEEGWECVQYADLGDRRGALLLSAWDPVDGAAQTAVYTGHDRGDRFEPETVQRLDHGPDFYAPALMRAPDGRWLIWGWVWEARDEARVGAVSAWTDEVGWAGMLSLPRELTLTDDGIAQRPARELQQQRSSLLIDTKGAVSRDDRLLLLGKVTHSIDIEARIGRAADGEATAGLVLATSQDGTERLDVFLDPADGDVVVDRDAASLDVRAKRGVWRVPTRVRPGEHLDLRIVIDRSVVEVFVDGHVLTMRFYPVGEGPWRLAARLLGCGDAAYEVRAWALGRPPCDGRGSARSSRPIGPYAVDRPVALSRLCAT